MKKIKIIVLIGLISLMGLTTCVDAQESNSVNGSENKIRNENREQFTSQSNEIPFKGGMIHIETKGTFDEIYTVQEITLQKNDIKVSS